LCGFVRFRSRLRCRKVEVLGGQTEHLKRLVELVRYEHVRYRSGVTTSSQAPRSRRERPAKAALTREGIVSAAVTLMRTEGLEKTTMRRVAAELDTGAASLYVYVRNTAELHAAILDRLLQGLDLSPVTASGCWRDRLVQMLFSYGLFLFEFPALARSALVSRPSGPGYLDLLEGLLALLDEGGVEPGRAAWGVDLLLQFATATAAEQSTRDRALDAQDEIDAAAAAIRNVTALTHPHVAALGEELMSGADGERFSWGFHVLIDGVAHTPRPEPEI